MQRIENESLRRILVLRLNRKLGNAVLLTPLLRSLRASCPHAEIDLLFGSEQGCVLHGLGGLRGTLRIPGWTRFPGWLRELRGRRYDLAVDPCLNSTSNRLALLLCGARARLGFAGRDQWLRLTHPVPPEHEMRHEALRPLHLLAEAMQSPRLESFLDLELSDAELRAGRDRLAGLGIEQGRRRVGFFREAAGAKKLDPAWWARWLAAMNRPGFQAIEILAPGATPLAPLGLSEKHPRKLAAILAAFDLFVCCDTGPMHLASAAHVPTFGLFSATDPVQYRPYGAQDSALPLADHTPESIAGIILRARPASRTEPRPAPASNDPTSRPPGHPPERLPPPGPGASSPTSPA